MTAVPVGKGQIRREGRSGLAILVFGTLLESARKIAERLDATLVNMRFVKPLDEALVLSLAERHSAFVTIEENSVMGGAGSAVGEVLAAAGVLMPLAANRHSRQVHRARFAGHLSSPRRASMQPGCQPASIVGGHRSWRVACAPRKAHDRLQIGVSAHPQRARLHPSADRRGGAR
jgi:hypothetical protein